MYIILLLLVYKGFNRTFIENHDPPMAISRWYIDPGIDEVVEPVRDRTLPEYSIEPTPGI